MKTNEEYCRQGLKNSESVKNPDSAILETERLRLRYQKEDDLEFMIRLWTDAETTKFVGGPRDRQKLIVSFDDIAPNPMKEEFDLWYIELKNTGELIGMAGLLQKTVENENFYEINYYIEQKHRNKSFATEIAKGIIAHFSYQKNIKTFIAIIDKENLSSTRVAKKTGMTYWKTESRSKGEKEIYRVNL